MAKGNGEEDEEDGAKVITAETDDDYGDSPEDGHGDEENAAGITDKTERSEGSAYKAARGIIIRITTSTTRSSFKHTSREHYSVYVGARAH